MHNEENEIRGILEEEGALGFEAIPESGFSPLNEPVIEKDIARMGKPTNENGIPENGAEAHGFFGEGEPDGPLDAPEQEINEGAGSDGEGQNDMDESFDLPDGHARQAADSLLGMVDNLIGVGGGFFVKIRKEPGYYDFEELIQVIDEQNDKNVRRIKLDQDDKDLLRPILMAILKKKAKKLTPEQQLIGAAMTIVVKKFQTVMEVRQENLVLESRIRAIVLEATGQTEEGAEDEADSVQKKQQPTPTEETLEPEAYEEIPETLAATVIEVAADNNESG